MCNMLCLGGDKRLLLMMMKMLSPAQFSFVGKLKINCCGEYSGERR